MSYFVSGINAVRENLRRGNNIIEILIAKQRKMDRILEILDMAGKKSIPIKFKEKSHLDRILPNLSHQGIIAFLKNYRYFHLDELIKIALKSKGKGFLLIADHITDTGNLGALIRTAEFFGVQGLILPKDRSAFITDTVHRTSAGGSAYLPVTRVVNLSRTIDQLANNDLWIIGTSEESKTSIYEFDWNRDIVLVMGSEGKGLSRVVRDKCHHMVSIPGFGQLDSLNVSVASGVIFSEIVRQRIYTE
ncbi:MAG: 23S rRNA (guanosine(2251)-2'-O)-methyltransferase RlmB [Thermodesulfobacteriota bacterium]|nr:23S rRNA (guanosine(2251)-2'-O)-methyltransferase RlmB [Thermodesulfobacteriota bacterium]